MKKHFLKLTALAIAGTFVLAACGSDAPIAPPPPPATEQATTEPAQGTETTTEPEATGRGWVRDLEGREIRILCWWEYSISSDSPMPSPDDPGNFALDMMWYDNIRRIEDEFNAYIRTPVVTYDDMLPMLTASVMAGDPAADIFMMTGPNTLSALVNNLILPASQFATPDADIFGPNALVARAAQWDGEIWSFHRAEYDLGPGALGVNLDIINAIGAENPVDLFNRGQWTWHAWREIMMLATRDTTGDGVIDQFGMAGHPGDFIGNLIAANDGYMIDNDLQFAYDHPNTLVALEFAYDLFATDRVWFYDSGLGGMDSGDWNRNFWSFQEGRAAFWIYARWAMDDAVPFEYALVPFPIGPNNTRGYTNTMGFPQALVIPVGVLNPHDVYDMYQEHMTWAYGGLMSEGAVEWIRGGMLDEADVWRLLHDAGFTRKFDMGNVVPQYNWIHGDFAAQFFDGEATVAQAIETARQPQQDLIDAVFR